MIYYTDGGCEPNPGQGAWAWCIDKQTYESGFEKQTTNNRMELMGIIKAIEHFCKEGYSGIATIHTDSQYCCKGFSSWMYGWQQSGWKRGKHKEPVKNQDLWEILWENRNKAQLIWVKGHAGIELNEFADELCNKEMGFEPPKTLNGLMDWNYEWAHKVFPDHATDPLAPLHHLKNEVEELIEAIEGGNEEEFLEEYADCIILLTGSFRRLGYRARDLLEASYAKMDKNEKREWGKPDENGVYKQVKQ